MPTRMKARNAHQAEGTWTYMIFCAGPCTASTGVKTSARTKAPATAASPSQVSTRPARMAPCAAARASLLVNECGEDEDAESEEDDVIGHQEPEPADAFQQGPAVEQRSRHLRRPGHRRQHEREQEQRQQEFGEPHTRSEGTEQRPDGNEPDGRHDRHEDEARQRAAEIEVEE